MAWVSPTGHNDPSNMWDDEAYAYDGVLSTEAYATVPGYSWGDYLELTVPSLYCKRARFYARGQDGASIDLYYESDWHNIYEGSFAYNAWVEKTNVAGLKLVTAARIKFQNVGMDPAVVRLSEFDFHKVVGPFPTFFRPA